MAELTDAEVAWVLSSRKTVSGRVAWTPRPGEPDNRLRLSVEVSCPHAEHFSLRVIGYRGDHSWGYAFLIDGVVVRRCEATTAGHTNPDGTRITKRHKHRWSELHGDREAYIPNDIDFSDVNQAFFDFLAECTISFQGEYRRFRDEERGGRQ